MRARLFTLVTALSLLMFVAATVLWIRSHYHSDGVKYYAPYGMYQFESVAGVVVTGRSSLHSRDGKFEWHFYSEPSTTDIPLWWEGHPVLMRLGFGTSDEYWRVEDAGRWFMAPDWVFMAAFAVLPLLWLIRVVRCVRSNGSGCFPLCSSLKLRIFAFASALSLLTCATTVALWVRSCWVNDFLLCDAPSVDVYISNLQGEVLIDISRPLDEYNRPTTRIKRYVGSWGWHLFRDDSPGTIDRLPGDKALFWSWAWRFGIATGPRWNDDHHAVLFPHWFALSVALVMPALWVLRRGTRALAGYCPECGYDLRATPDRCPECGRSGAATQRA